MLTTQPHLSRPKVSTFHASAGEGEKIIPHSVEAEEAVLGSLLIDRDLVATVASLLKPEHFFSEARANLYRAILSLYSDRTPADAVMLKAELKVLGVLGEGDGQVSMAYLIRLMHDTPSPVHIEYYLKIVLKHWLARQLIAECSQSIADAFEPATEPNQALANLSGRLQELAGRITSQQAGYFLSHETSLDYIWRFDQTDEELKAKAASELPSLRFGWNAFDGRDWSVMPTLCLLPATLTTILARTGGGKTIAAMQIADANAQAGLNVLYFHVELNQQQMLARRYCRLTSIPVLAQLRNQIGQSDRRVLVQAATQIASWPGRVDFVHCPNWSGDRLVQELKARHYALIASQGRGYDLIVLDYLQRLGRSEQTSRAPEHEALAANVRLLSDTLNELNLAGLMTSQVGRSESHQYDPPDLDEGLGTGDIERCSNQLLALAITEEKDKVKYVIRKNTFGEVGGSGELLYDPRRLQFI